MFLPWWTNKSESRARSGVASPQKSNTRIIDWPLILGGVGKQKEIE